MGLTAPPVGPFSSHIGFVEDYGIDLDIEAEKIPQAYKQGMDTKIEKAVGVILELVEASLAKPCFTSIVWS